MKRENKDERDMTAEQVEAERWQILRRVEDALEVPMVVLGIIWLVLLIVEFTRGLSPFLAVTGFVIWGIFVLDFLLEFLIAPRKRAYLWSNWLTLVALAVPALRVFRIARAFRLLRLTRTTRGLKLLRLLTSFNRGMRVLGATLGRRGFGYVLALTLIVLFAGAAGMYAFEQNPGGRGLNSYGTALWWTAMVLSTMGSEYWPQTPEGRMLCLLLALYAFTMFGYVTATLASVFVNFDAESDESQLGGKKSIDQLRMELAALRNEIKALGRDR